MPKDGSRDDLIETMQRIAQATPNNTNSSTPASMASWTQAVATSALGRATLAAPIDVGALMSSLSGVLALARLKFGNLDDDANTVFEEAEGLLGITSPPRRA